MRDLTELNKLEEYLKKRGIRYERRDADDELNEKDGLLFRLERHQIIVPQDGPTREWDVICQRGSSGAEDGLLEIYGKIVRPCGDSVEGYLTAEDVIERIEEVYGKDGRTRKARYTEIDTLIEDLRYDIELDARTLDDLDFADAKERELVQLDKIIKQNVISILEQTPTADVVERKKGKWIAVKVGNGMTRRTCSECGASYECDSRDVWEFIFCPKCGMQTEADNGRDPGRV